MIEDVFLRNPFNYDRDAVSDETGLNCQDESLASQEFRDEVDINTIATRFGLFGEMPTGVVAPTYGDFQGVGDYHTAMNAIATANEAFDTMPAAVRARFHNNPAEFVDFCSDEKNRDEAVKLGLVVPKAAELVSGEAPKPAEQAPGGTVVT